jgi:hypothetical protein
MEKRQNRKVQKPVLANSVLWIILFIVVGILPGTGDAKQYPWEKETQPPMIQEGSADISTGSDSGHPTPKKIYSAATASYLGKGVRKNYFRAFTLYMQAAEQGYAPAQHMAGVCCEYGRGTEKNLEQAFQYYLKGANRGYAKAQYKVGVFFWFGKGRKRNFKEAFKWYSRAAEKDFPPALNNLGVAFEHGYGTRKDLERALSCYRKGAEHGNAKSYENLVRLSKKTGKPVPAGIGNRRKLGCFDFQKSKKWVRLGADKEKEANGYLLANVARKGAVLILLRRESYGYTNRESRLEIEKKFTQEMAPGKADAVRHLFVNGHKTLLLRTTETKNGETDTVFTLLPYDDISFHIVVVLYNNQVVGKLTPEVRSFLSTLILRCD